MPKAKDQRPKKESPLKAGFFIGKNRRTEDLLPAPATSAVTEPVLQVFGKGVFIIRSVYDIFVFAFID